jgi:hypothetical protein
VQGNQRNAIIFHGAGGQPGNCWHPWLGGRLTARGYTVEIPHYPGINVEPVATLLPTIPAAHRFDVRTVLVGHSGDAGQAYETFELLDKLIDR